MARRYFIAPLAKTDLENIKAYTINEWGLDQAVNYLTNFEKRFEWLVENPELGKNRDDIIASLRSFPEGKHIVFYRISGNDIEIVGVPHQTQDPHHHFDS